MDNFKKFNKWKGREVIFIASYGSTNYGTRTPESDSDYKVFLMPTFEDLYRSEMFSDNQKIDGDDYEFHDIRKLPQLFYKANPAYLEILCAKEMWVNDKYKSFANWIFKNKFEIAKMNLKGHYHALTGMAKQKLHAIIRDLPNSQENEGYKRRMKFGFDTKQLLHIVRLMMMREAVYAYGLNPCSCVDLDVAPTRNNIINTDLKQQLLDIKANKDNLNKEQAIELANKYIGKCDDVIIVDEKLGKIKFIDYINQLEINEEMNKKLVDRVMQLVKSKFKKGMV